MTPRKRTPPERLTTRRYRSRGVDVEIGEAKDRVELKLDGQPVHVSIVDGKFSCQLANQFRTFDSIDEVVDTLLANEGRTWTLHGHVCDERCRGGGHHHHNGHAHVHGHGHDHGQGHDGGSGHGHAPRRKKGGAR